jgi:hypothetical protein
MIGGCSLRSVDGPQAACAPPIGDEKHVLSSNRSPLEASPSLLSSRAKPRDLQFRGPLLETFFEEAVWTLRPVGPTAKRQPSPAGLGNRFPTFPERRRRGTLSPQPASVRCRKTFPGRAYRTADPSASLGMTKGRVALPCASVGWWREPQIPPLRYAPVGMTIHIWQGRGYPRKIVIPNRKSQPPSTTEG